MFKPRILCRFDRATVTGCDKPVPPTSQARPVRTVAVERRAEGETVSLRAHIRAKGQASLAFRLNGRMIERPVNVGDVLKAGQVVAKLDPQIQQYGLNSAQAELASAEAVLTQARLTFGRQQQLVKDGWTSRANFDEARQKLETTQGQVDAARHSCAPRRNS
jgi:multidrug efflux pump subunit AcrA (membrane-fusion protein)